MADLYIGLISGTSMDGIDAVLVSFEDSGVQIQATHSEPYPQTLKDSLLASDQSAASLRLDSWRLAFSAANLSASAMRAFASTA